MSWLQILILGVAVGFGGDFSPFWPRRERTGAAAAGASSGWQRGPDVQRPAPHGRLAGGLPGAPAGAVGLPAVLSSPPRRRGAGIQEEARLHRRLALLLLLGTLPMIPALLLQTRAARLGRSPGVAVFLALNGLLLFLTDRVGHGKRDVRSATVADSLCMGLAQALSVVPGLSRTGLTMAAGILQGLSLEFSWKFSFLMAAPAMLLQSGVALLGALRSGRFILCALSGWNGLGRVVRLPVPAAFAVCSSPGGLR